MAMSKRFVTCVIALTSVAALETSRAAAQAPGVPPQMQPLRPPISPYLNLLRLGGGPALNYYNLVRPQQQLFAGINNLQQQVAANRALATAAMAVGADPTLPETGKATMFMNTGGYFMNMNPIGGAAAAPGVGRMGAGMGAGVGTPRMPPQPLSNRLPMAGRSAPRR
jgi:hypothetical protein